MQAYKDLVQALPGLKEDMPRAFYMLAELFDYGSFDICRSDDKYIIPYIMNDAVECYLTLENAVLNLDEHQLESPYRQEGWTVKQLGPGISSMSKYNPRSWLYCSKS